MVSARSDIRLLLTILLALSFGISLLYGDKEKAIETPPTQAAVEAQPTKANDAQNTQTHASPPTAPNEIETTNPEKDKSPDESSFESFTPEQASGQMAMLQESRSVRKIADTMQALSPEKAVAIATYIIENKTAMTNGDKLNLIFALATNYPDDKNTQQDLMHLILRYPNLYQGKPILVAAIDGGHATMIPKIIAWLKDLPDAKKTTPQIRDMIDLAYHYIIEHNNPKELDALLENGAPVAPKKANQLLWDVVEGNKNVAFVYLLVDRGAHINGEAKEGYSFLMKAVSLGDEPMVRALVGAGADVNAMHNPAVGTALQIAIEKDLGAIDEFLRKHGASESSKPKKNKV